MPDAMRGILSVAGRVLLCTIFLLSALGNDIPNYQGTVKAMAGEGVPAPQFLLAGAIVFLIAGSLSIIAGFKARVGAVLLFVFLVLATFFFHDFWTMEGKAQQDQIIQFMKNLALMGAMLMIVANGTGAWSLDNRQRGSMASDVA